MSFGEYVFSRVIPENREDGSKHQKELNHDENYSKRLQRTPGGNPPRQTPRGHQVELVGPTMVPPGLLGGPIYHLPEASSTAS
jgi:hypothetical protein